MNEKLLEIYRSDFTNSLIHLTRDQTVWKGFDEIDEERKALDVLKLILGEGVIKGGSGFIKFHHRFKIAGNHRFNFAA